MYDQDERLSEEAFQIGGSYESSVTASLRLKPSSRWIRIELLAREKAASGDGPLFTLATSNFFGLDGVL
ncbi:MAG: hypothetical protein EOP09_10310 [Proteobacteria bacterium]|nr:MAG: hypothetical protein EOP09_10310 [Pseudomonadota bacterium]